MKHGFAVMDANLHVVEPPDLWERYTAAPFCDRAPKLRRVRETGRGSYIAFEGQTFPTVPESAGRRRLELIKHLAAQLATNGPRPAPEC